EQSQFPRGQRHFHRRGHARAAGTGPGGCGTVVPSRAGGAVRAGCRKDSGRGRWPPRGFDRAGSSGRGRASARRHTFPTLGRVPGGGQCALPGPDRAGVSPPIPGDALASPAGIADSEGVNSPVPGPAQQDPSHAVLQSERHPLNPFFQPQSVAVIGATPREGTVGRTVLANLTGAGFRGKVWPVNPGHAEILGRPCFAAVGKIPEPVDLAVIATPAATVPGVVGECVAAGVKAAIVISAGFRERGAEGQELERQVAQRLRGSRMRLIGPNCLGVMNPHVGLNATFAQTIARPGNVAFLSQSGALQTAILGWSLEEQVGFSAFVSTGSMLDVGWGDLIDYLGDDPHTKSILIYMESVGDARSF